LMEHHLLTATELCLWYVDRIQRYDANALRSVLELNPDLLPIAAALDDQWRTGAPRGRLHGIPVLLKDTIGTGDQLHTTAGAAALADARSDRDALLVRALREEGAIILGKANMSEWSYWMAASAPSGYSALGGQTLGPYGVDPWGSSTGSGVAATANFATLTVGCETAGSIIAPSCRNSIVGMYPTTGLVSRDRVIPLCEFLDSLGPMCRTVRDAAELLTVIATPFDDHDLAGLEARTLHGLDFTERLDRDALRGKRLRFLPTPETSGMGLVPVANFYGLGPAITALQDAGATVVMVPGWNFGPAGFVETTVNWSFRRNLNAYLSETGAPVRTLREIIAFNTQDPATNARYGQERLIWADNTRVRAEDAAAAQVRSQRSARAMIDTPLRDLNLDALVGIDNVQSLIYPYAGYPAVTVPAGLVNGRVPHGITFIGGFPQDAAMLAYAYAFEQASKMRVMPKLTPPTA
ncbi:MAG: amidase family protein, partial [Chloroflexota bacterium]